MCWEDPGLTAHVFAFRAVIFVSASASDAVCVVGRANTRKHGSVVGVLSMSRADNIKFAAKLNRRTFSVVAEVSCKKCLQMQHQGVLFDTLKRFGKANLQLC